MREENKKNEGKKNYNYICWVWWAIPLSLIYTMFIGAYIPALAIV